MRFAIAVLALAASASATLVARQIPSCASSCIMGPNVDLGGCSPTDNVCLCKSDTFVTKSTSCIESACSGSELDTALSVARQICASVGVTLTSQIHPATTAPASSSAHAPASSSTPVSSSPPAASASTSAPASATSSNAAAIHRGSANALAGLAAVGLAAFAL